MAGAQAQHSLGNRETPRIAAGIFPIGGASGQRMRRYFFGASPPGEGGGGNNTKKPGATGRGRNSRKEPGTMRVPQCQKCQTTPPATRTGRRGQPAGQTTGGGQRAAHSRKQAAGDGQRAAGGPRQKAGSGRAAIRRAGGSIALKGRFHVHTNSDYRAPELRHSNGPRQRESENDPEPAPPRSGKKHAGKQVLSTEIPRIHRKRDIRRPLTNYH